MIDTTRPVDRTGNTFCGPLVVAAIMGTSTGQVCELVAAGRRAVGGVRLAHRVKRVRARTAAAIKSTYDSELFALLESHGYNVENVPVGARYIRDDARPTWVREDSAVRILAALRDDADNNSDGWAHWSVPVRAAAKLIALVEPGIRDWLPPPAIHAMQLRKALTPIRAFYTRAHRGDYGGAFPATNRYLE